jgi:acetyl esterase/lipase
MASWLFLAASLVGAAFTFNAFFPVRRNRVLFLASFFASWITIELAWFHIVWEVVATIIFIRFGALESWPGWVALAIAFVNWVLLLVVVVRGRQAGGAADTALVGVADAVVVDSGKVKRTRNLTYRRVAGREIRLDVFEPALPPKSGERRPAILQIHGGAWMIGDKREQGLPLLKYLAARGWVGFNANYRLSPGATWPDHLTDLKHAVAFIRRHADDYGVDPDFIAVTGGSAGGHLTTMMALTANDPDYQAGIEDADTSLQAAVPFYGVYDFTNRNETMPPEFVKMFLEPLIMKRFLADEPEAFAKASPLDQVHPGAPPFFVIHGDNDTLAPVEDARDFVTRLGDTSHQPVYYLELRGAQHAFDVFSSIRSRRVVRAVHRFLAATHQNYLEGHPTEEVPADVVDTEAVAVDDSHAERVS